MSDPYLNEAMLAALEKPTCAELYQRYRGELVAFVRGRFGPGPPEPEDVAQQAFVNFFATASRQDVRNPRAFLYRTVTNLVINYRRHERVGRRLLESAPSAEKVLRNNDELSPEIILETQERYALVEAAIRAMPGRTRLYLLMNRVEGLSYAEIARRTKRSETVVRKHVERAVRECGRILLQACQPRPADGGKP